MAQSRRIQAGFTLIELLVVVSIISLLLTILMPSLRGARESARMAVCRNNLRCIWTGIRAYSLEFGDDLPFMEDINLSDPNADPFDSAYPTSVGTMLMKYVNPGSWRCPSATSGYPVNAPRGQWKMTYMFKTAGKVGEGVAYRDDARSNTGSVLDPAISNYLTFDGRPIRVLDGRRYVPSLALNKNKKGNWNARNPIIWEAMGEYSLTNRSAFGDPGWNGRPEYPHRGQLEKRSDLKNSYPAYSRKTNGLGKKSGAHELHADGDKVEIYYTRYHEQHDAGI